MPIYLIMALGLASQLVGKELEFRPLEYRDSSSIKAKKGVRNN
jgi:hypothetical protein